MRKDDFSFKRFLISTVVLDNYMVGGLVFLLIFFLLRLSLNLFFHLVDAVLETSHSLAQTSHKFRYLLSAKEQQYNQGNDNNLARA